jgi:glycosyltransferase 2 family protein
VKFLIKLAVALTVGAVCLALVVKDMDPEATWRALRQVPLAAVPVYLVTLAVTHIFRVWRWKYLLKPIGVALPWRHLFSISSVGFMAILALPVRLGEFVRPYFVVRLGKSRMSAVLGTVAVERVIDGLLISLLFFASYLASEEGAFSTELRFAAWLSLAGFLAATIFLASALRFPGPTIHLALAVSLLPRLSPRLAEKVADKLRALIQGFRVLREPANLVPYLVQSVLYWGTNGFGMWILARSMELPISPLAAYAAMAFTGVLISLPNSPGLVGQFHLGVVAALAAYLPDATLRSTGIAYATLLHGVQLLWYVAIGFACLLFVPGGARSLRQVVLESNRAADESLPAVDRAPPSAPEARLPAIGPPEARRW